MAIIDNIMDKSEAEWMEKETTRELQEVDDVQVEEDKTLYKTANYSQGELDV